MGKYEIKCGAVKHSWKWKLNKIFELDLSLTKSRMMFYYQNNSNEKYFSFWCITFWNFWQSFFFFVIMIRTKCLAGKYDGKIFHSFLFVWRLATAIQVASNVKNAIFSNALKRIFITRISALYNWWHLAHTRCRNWCETKNK
jgi:hypothetical protein